MNIASTQMDINKKPQNDLNNNILKTTKSDFTDPNNEANDLNEFVDVFNDSFGDLAGALSFALESSNYGDTDKLKLKLLKSTDGELKVEKEYNYSLSDYFSCEFDIRMLIINMILGQAEKNAIKDIEQSTISSSLKNIGSNNFYAAVEKFLSGLGGILNRHKEANNLIAASSRASSIGKIASGAMAVAAGVAKSGTVLGNNITDYQTFMTNKVTLMSDAASSVGQPASAGADIESSRIRNDADDEKDTINILMQQMETLKSQCEKVSDSMQQGASETERNKQELIQKAQQLMNDIFRLILRK